MSIYRVYWPQVGLSTHREPYYQLTFLFYSLRFLGSIHKLLFSQRSKILSATGTHLIDPFPLLTAESWRYSFEFFSWNRYRDGEAHNASVSQHREMMARRTTVLCQRVSEEMLLVLRVRSEKSLYE